MPYEKAGPNDEPQTGLAKTFIELAALKSSPAQTEGKSAAKPDDSLESTSSLRFRLREKFNLDDQRIIKDVLEEPRQPVVTASTYSIPASAALERLRDASATAQSSDEIVQRLSRKLGI